MSWRCASRPPCRFKGRRSHLLQLLALAGSALAGMGEAAETPIATADPVPLPSLTFETMDGRPTSLEAFRGKVVVLNLWATWCAPCREEMPSLDRLQARFKDQPVVVVALSVDRAGPERVRAFLDEIGVQNLAVYRDPKAAATRTLRVPGLPATLLVDKEGRERARVLGIAEWDAPQAVEAVQRLLGEGSGTAK
jgi:thiol-disulfide isomerase/thioredoxin